MNVKQEQIEEILKNNDPNNIKSIEDFLIEMNTNEAFKYFMYDMFKDLFDIKDK